MTRTERTQRATAHRAGPMQRTDAEIRVNSVPAAHGITVPATAALLHYS